MPAMIARALTIAGSDSGGGAGIQADLKTFTVFGVYGMSALTALTAQNTCGVRAIHAVPPDFVREQIDAVVTDIGVDATKTGMLATGEIVVAVARAVRDHRLTPLIVDPVMLAASGAALLAHDARDALRRELLPLATLVTPNLHEAQVLTGIPIGCVDDMRTAARALIRDGRAQAVLIKGGHLEGEPATDVFDDGSTIRELTAARVRTPHTHGTGCQLSAAICAQLARGARLPGAIACAKEFITAALHGALALGHGAGPANPLVWKRAR
jgi:hydroxymethylpyrimidine/phosphomethylpyrimidine kinase